MDDLSATDAIVVIVTLSLFFIFLLRVWDSGDRPYRNKYSYRRLMRRLRDNNDFSTTYTYYSKKTKGEK